MRSVSPVVLAGGQVFASLVILAPFSFLIDGIPDLRLISGASWLGMLVASVSAPVAA